MTRLDLTLPGEWAGVAPQRDPSQARDAVRWPHWMLSLVAGKRRVDHRHAAFVAQVRVSRRAEGLDAAVIRRRLGRSDATEADLVAAFALVTDTFERVLGQAPYDVQIAAARALLDGHLTEMRTGEGKTLVAALAACVAALAGAPVHVLTANDYLVERDAAWLRPVCAALGLDVDGVTSAKNPEERRRAYACAIVYGTAKELVFDYLRDRLAEGTAREPLEMRITRMLRTSQVATSLRGLYFCIIDEADSILLDEARTPLILAREAEACDTSELQAALDAARALHAGVDFELDRRTGHVELRHEGSSLEHDERVELALAALHLYVRDHDYVIIDDKVQIVDANTGRVAEGRAWSRGLHQLIELKENLPVTRDQQTIARLTYQRFFPRYHRVCGLSGTLFESAGELHGSYELRVLQVPPRRPLKMTHRQQVYLRDGDRWQAVIDEIQHLHARRRPVLIGTASVDASQKLSERLARAGLLHTVLNARQDRDEALTIARAGCAGSITVATNMAGRGTDIRLDDEARSLGGLHVLATQFNESARIDRQLWGRCARQGDPGSVSVHAWLGDGLFRHHLPSALATTAANAFASRATLPARATRVLVALAQWRCERRDRRARAELRRHDETMDRRLAFGSISE